jgi:hypothetical protein
LGFPKLYIFSSPILLYPYRPLTSHKSQSFTWYFTGTPIPQESTSSKDSQALHVFPATPILPKATSKQDSLSPTGFFSVTSIPLRYVSNHDSLRFPCFFPGTLVHLNSTSS